MILSLILKCTYELLHGNKYIRELLHGNHNYYLFLLALTQMLCGPGNDTGNDNKKKKKNFGILKHLKCVAFLNRCNVS